jgi:hypothetical protein
MIVWKRVKSASEWGFFFGVVTWLLASGSTNTFTWKQVWAVIIVRTLMGLAIGILPWKTAWWIRGLVVGAVLNIPFAFVVQTPGFGWIKGFWPALISGLVFAVLIELVLKHKEKSQD